MQGIGIVNHKQTTIEEMLNQTDTRYSVPYFQREYSWTKDDWIDFFEDIEKTQESNNYHFFGFMALQKQSPYINIIEGQQRIATVLILVSVVRDIFKEKRFESWSKIEEEYLKTSDTLSESAAIDYKLELSEINKSFFRDFIQESNNPDEKLSRFKLATLDLSNRLIYNCYKFFYDKLTEKLKKLNEEERNKYLLQIIRIPLRRFIVFTIDVEDEIAAYNIFQTLNDRGLDLGTADLLKIHLFNKSGTALLQEAKDRWDEIRNLLSQIKLNTFLRHYWLSHYAVVQEKDLLREFQKEIKTDSDAYSFLKELRIEAEIYEALVNPRVDYWVDEEIVELLNNLKIISALMPLPILLAGNVKLQSSDFKRLIKTLISFLIRYVTIGERDNKTLEKLLSDISINLRRGEITRLSEIRKLLMAEYVDDKTFEQQFIKNEMKATKVAKYVLQEIEQEVAGKREKFDKTISVEHILPKNPDDECQKYIEDNSIDKDAVVHRIGNMTLLLGKVNSNKAKNKIFNKKRDEVFAKEDQTILEINKPLASITSWTEFDIEGRQKWFAEKAVKIWKLHQDKK